VGYRWLVVDTRRLDGLESIVDGLVHVLPHRAAQKHWVASDCWCDPVVTWNCTLETAIVSHNRVYPPQFEHLEA